MFITGVSLKRPTFAIVVVIALLAVGIVGFMGLSINEMPNFNMPYVSVEIVLPGASPDQVESKVTKVVEDAVGQITGVKHVSSIVSEGDSWTNIEFNDSIKADAAAQEVRSKISGIRDSFPADINEPVISIFKLNELPILSLSVTGNLSPDRLSDLVVHNIVPELNTVSGVGSIKANGLMKREIQIKVDQEKLSALNLNVDQVANGLRSDNIDSPSGRVSNDLREVTLRTYSSIKTMNDFRDVIIATVNGAEIRLGDVAEVIKGYQAQSNTACYDGKECIGIDINKQSGANTVKVADGIKYKIAQLQKSLPEGIRIDVVIDNSESIRSSVKSVESTLIEGAALAVLVVFLFLRSLGSTVVSAVSLPTSIITTFAAIKIMGFSLNTMSLMGLSLSIGLLIDDAIVVVENIVRHLKMGKTPFQAAEEATNEISLAVLASTLTIVAVFLPLSVMGGMLGDFFKEFGLTIAFAVLISMFISFTLVPLLSSRIVKDEENREPRTKLGVFLRWFNHQFDTLALFTNKALTLALEHRKKTIIITALMFALSLMLIPVMGMSFTPEKDTGIINISAGLDAGLSLNVAKEKAKMIEKIIEKYPEVKRVYTTVGKDSISLRLTLTDKKDRNRSAKEISLQMRSQLKKIPGLDLAVTGSAEGKSYSLHIQGNDFAQLLEYSQKAKRLLAEIPGTVDVGISYKAGKPETRIQVDRDAAADLGVAPSSISNTLNTLFNGTSVGKFDDNGDRLDVKISVQGSQSKDIDSLNGIYLPSTNNSGIMIPMDQLTKKVYATASSQIERYDKKRDIQLQANYVGKKSSDLGSLFMEKLNSELPPPKGISIGVGGDEQSMQDSAAPLVQAVILGILFIFLILAAQFESWIDPLAIMFSLPLAMIGAMVASFLTGAGLSMVGLIGIIFLMGLVNKNAILLIDFIKKRRHDGMDRKEAILEAVMVRLRPIMMTTLAMIFGMLPLAISSGTGSEMRQPMAIAIIGGLVSSTLLTLLVIPVIYSLLDDLKGKIRRKKAVPEQAVGETL